jgi:hypothetical protein
MKMVGDKTESIYRRYAIADERSMTESARSLIDFLLSTSNKQSNGKAKAF